jgi:hypothetical protein
MGIKRFIFGSIKISLTNFKERSKPKIKYNAQDYCKKAGDILMFDVAEISKGCPATGKMTGNTTLYYGIILIKKMR